MGPGLFEFNPVNDWVWIAGYTIGVLLVGIFVLDWITDRLHERRNRDNPDIIPQVPGLRRGSFGIDERSSALRRRHLTREKPGTEIAARRGLSPVVFDTPEDYSPTARLRHVKRPLPDVSSAGD